MSAPARSHRLRVLGSRHGEPSQIPQQGAAAIGLAACCRRIGLSYGYGRQLIADGKFPIPELPKLSRRGHHRFSTANIDRYLARAATAEVR